MHWLIKVICYIIMPLGVAPLGWQNLGDLPPTNGEIKSLHPNNVFWMVPDDYVNIYHNSTVMQQHTRCSFPVWNGIVFFLLINFIAILAFAPILFSVCLMFCFYSIIYPLFPYMWLCNISFSCIPTSMLVWYFWDDVISCSNMLHKLQWILEHTIAQFRGFTLYWLIVSCTPVLTHY